MNWAFGILTPREGKMRKNSELIAEFGQNNYSFPGKKIRDPLPLSHLVNVDKCLARIFFYFFILKKRKEKSRHLCSLLTIRMKILNRKMNMNGKITLGNFLFPCSSVCIFNRE